MNTGFTCVHCNKQVSPHPTSVRNHCPYCLYSRHVDTTVPGDRAESCGGSMQPIRIEQRHGTIRIVHECTKCAFTRINDQAPDDDLEALLKILPLS